MKPTGSRIPAASSQAGNDDCPVRQCRSTAPDVAAVHRTIHYRLFLNERAYTFAVEDLHIQAMARSAQGYGDGDRHQRQGQGRSQSGEPGEPPEPAGTAAGLPVRPSGQDGPDLHVVDLRSLWPCSQGQPAVAGGIGVWRPVGTGRMPTTTRQSTAWPVGHHRPVWPAGQGSLYGEAHSRQGLQQSVNTMCRNCFNPVGTDVRSLSAGWAPRHPSHPVPTVFGNIRGL